MASDLVRYSILTVRLLSMSMLLANTVLFNFTVICMKPEDRGETALNATRYYSAAEEGWIMSMTAVGNIIGTLPAIYLTDHFGLRMSYTLFGFLSGVTTALYPLAAADIYIALVVRLFQGFGMACAFVAMGIIPMEYGGDKGKGMFVTVLTCSYQIGPFSTMPVSAAFCESAIGWSGVYYLFGAVTVVLFAAFVVIYKDRTETRRTPSTAKVLPKAEQDPTLSKEVVPYKEIFSTSSVWGILTTGFGDSLGYFVFFLYGPIYVNKVLNFEVEQTGVFAAIPYAVSMGTKFLGGIFLYKGSCISEQLRIMLFTVSSQAIMSVNFIVLTLLSSSMPLLAEFIFTITVAVSGLHFIGLMTAAQIVSQKYTHIISSAIAAQESLIGLLLPPLVSVIAPNHNPSEWATVFYYIVAVLVLTNISFVVLTKIKPAKWTREDRGSIDTADSEMAVKQVE
uniref:MFS domain-containing protein n=2 Tax=Steinernema glaseri TaxID=37863 RepID=A0A1I7YSV9_9BILA